MKTDRVTSVAMLLSACVALFTSGCAGPQSHHTEAEEAVLRFAVIGDTQGQHLFPSLLERLNEEGAEYLVVPGDLVDNGGTAEGQYGSWESWVEQARAFEPGLRKIFVTPGNHDLPPGSDERWQEVFRETPDGHAWLPDSPRVDGRRGFDQMDYYADVGGVRFISVTTDTRQHGYQRLADNTREWLMAALELSEADPSIEHVFVFTHHPVTFDSQAESIDGTEGAFWTGMLERSQKMRALFTGHWHLFQPSRPDAAHPRVWEVVTGTGGGGLEGRPSQNHHGFLIVDVLEHGDVRATFFSDLDGAHGGWAFDDALDTFTMWSPHGSDHNALVASYEFEHGGVLLDSERGPGAKRVHGEVEGLVRSTPGVHGQALVVSDATVATAHAIGDYELAIVGDLTLDLAIRSDVARQTATLLEYGSAGNHPDAESEAVNTCYSLGLDGGYLSLAWEHGSGTDVVVRSSAPFELEEGAWTAVRCTRDSHTREVMFYVDGRQVGDPVHFENHPSGGGAGFLHFARRADGSAAFQGALDNVRIYREVIARTVDRVPVHLAGDLNHDHTIDATDLRVLADLSESGGSNLDFDRDGRFHDSDLEILLAALHTDGHVESRGGKGRDAPWGTTPGSEVEALGPGFGKAVYWFAGNHGLVIDASGDQAQYRLSLQFGLQSFGNGKWGKLVDFANRTDDAGLYVRETPDGAFLEFYPARGRGATKLERGRFYQVDVMRDASTNQVEVFLDGRREFSFADQEREAVTTDGHFHLFCDDRGNETLVGGMSHAEFSTDEMQRPSWLNDWRFPLLVERDRVMNIQNRMPEPLEAAMVVVTAFEGRTAPDWEPSDADWLRVSFGPSRFALVRRDGRPISVEPLGDLILGSFVTTDVPCEVSMRGVKLGGVSHDVPSYMFD